MFKIVEALVVSRSDEFYVRYCRSSFKFASKPVAVSPTYPHHLHL